ncbi:MAG: hypothetical protein R6X15_03765 [Pseudomonadota bacterium]
MAEFKRGVSGLMEKHLIILKTGDKLASLSAVAGDYEDWIREGMGFSFIRSLMRMSFPLISTTIGTTWLRKGGRRTSG